MGKDSMNQENYFVYNKAVQDMTEKIRMACATYAIGTDRKTGDLIYAHSDGTWHNLLNDIMNQMKEQMSPSVVYEVFYNPGAAKEYRLFNMFYSKEQAEEFAKTVGDGVLSEKDIQNIYNLVKKGVPAVFLWELEKSDIERIPSKYADNIVLNQTMSKSTFQKMKDCMNEYISTRPSNEVWRELGANNDGEVVFLRHYSNGDKLRGTIDEYGYVNIVDNDNNSVYRKKITTEEKAPVYELYKNLDNKYTLRTIFYSPEQIEEFCCTAGKRIMSASGQSDLLKRLEKDGFVATSWDTTSLGVKDIPDKYVSLQEKYDILQNDIPSYYWKLKACLDKYVNFQPDIYRWHELGVNHNGELIYLHGCIGGGILRCAIGEDGYPDIFNERNESVFDYRVEMYMSEEDINEIRGIEPEDREY